MLTGELEGTQAEVLQSTGDVGSFPKPTNWEAPYNKVGAPLLSLSRLRGTGRAPGRAPSAWGWLDLAPVPPGPRTALYVFSTTNLSSALYAAPTMPGPCSRYASGWWDAFVPTEDDM